MLTYARLFTYCSPEKVERTGSLQAVFTLFHIYYFALSIFVLNNTHVYMGEGYQLDSQTTCMMCIILPIFLFQRRKRTFVVVRSCVRSLASIGRKGANFNARIVIVNSFRPATTLKADQIAWTIDRSIDWFFFFFFLLLLHASARERYHREGRARVRTVIYAINTK